jgi:hypothetical protein
MNKNIIITLFLVVIIVIASFTYYHVARKSNKRESQYSIVQLYEDGKIVMDESLSNPIVLPPDTRNHRAIRVKSNLMKDLINAKVLAGCSCTDVTFNRDRLIAGDSGEIIFIYDSLGKRGDNVINLTLTSANYPPFKLRFRCKILDDPSLLHVNISPQSINIDEIWKPEMELTYLVTAIFNENIDIDLDRLGISASKPYINTNINSKENLANTVEIITHLKNPPASEINEQTTLSYVYEGNQYELSIPINGRIKRAFEVVPSIVNLGELFDKSKANVTVTINIIDPLTEKPVISVDGDWEIIGIQNKVNTIHVELALKEPIGDKYCSGQLTIGNNNIDKTPLVVPIFATLQAN